MEIPEDFIEAHIAICHRSKPDYERKHPNPKPQGERKGRGAWVRRTPRECARRLYKACIKLGIEPTIDREAFVRQYDELNGLKPSSSDSPVSDANAPEVTPRKARKI